MNRLNSITQQVQPCGQGKACGPVTAVHTNGKCPYMAKKNLKPAINVCVTGAGGNIGYSLIFQIVKGAMLGPDQPVNLRLLDIPQVLKTVGGVKMELDDGAYPLLNSVVATSDYKVAFDNVEIALLVGARPRGPGMLRGDLLLANSKIFEGQGAALDKYAARHVKICVVGNPANTNCLITMKHAPSLPKSAFSALTRLDQLRATSVIANKLGVHSSQVKNIIIWGNHSATQYPDVNHGYIEDFPRQGMRTSIRAAVNDDEYLDGPFIKTVQGRGKAVINARGKSSAASAANAVVDHMKSWHMGTAPGETVSMAVPSDGNAYGVPDGLIYSFPCTINNGKYAIVSGFPVSKYSRELFNATAVELMDEKKAVIKN